MATYSTSPRIMPWLTRRWKGSLWLTMPMSYNTCTSAMPPTHLSPASYNGEQSSVDMHACMHHLDLACMWCILTHMQFCIMHTCLRAGPGCRVQQQLASSLALACSRQSYFTVRLGSVTKANASAGNARVSSSQAAKHHSYLFECVPQLHSHALVLEYNHHIF